MAMTPAKRRATRNKYEQESKARKDVRLGLTKAKANQKNKKRK